MKIALQICLLNGWSNNPAVIHEVDNIGTANSLAYLLSHQFANATVRMTIPQEGVEITQEYINNLSGTYFSASEPNRPSISAYVNRLINGPENY